MPQSEKLKYNAIIAALYNWGGNIDSVQKKRKKGKVAKYELCYKYRSTEEKCVLHLSSLSMLSTKIKYHLSNLT